MNFGNGYLHEEETIDINITPLIDIVFLLLIFFMVSTTFAESHAIKVKLPSANTTPVETASKDFTVSMRKDGQVFLNGKPVTIDSLPQAIGKLLASGTHPALILRADKEVEHGRVVNVMDIARTAGVKKIAVATVPKG